MARFSVMQEDDNEGPSSPRPKRQRATRRQLLDIWLDEDEEIVEAAEYEEEDEEEEEAVSEEQEVEDEELEDEEEEEEMEGAGQASNAPVKSSDRDSNADASISITLTDPDVLDCPICLEPLTIPVFQCENGHVACSCCCSKIRNKCPTCSLPIGYNRCRAIEKVLESIKISCRNMKYECKEMVSYSNKHHHEEICIYAPCSCPLPDCDFVGNSKCLYLHFRNKHSNSATRFCFDKMFSVCLQMNQNYLILQEQKENTIFILNHAADRLGNVVNIDCIGPNHAADRLGNVVNIDCIGPSTSKNGFSYELMAKNGGSSVRLQYFIESIPRWSVHIPQKAFLLVPSGFLGCEQLRLQICISNQDSTVCYRSTNYLTTN